MIMIVGAETVKGIKIKGVNVGFNLDGLCPRVMVQWNGTIAIIHLGNQKSYSIESCACSGGTALYMVGPSDDLDDIKESVMANMRTVLNMIDKSGDGVLVQASTLGSLEALLEFMKTPTVNIHVSDIGVGPVCKKDDMMVVAMIQKKGVRNNLGL
ncbi:eukaryotic translation initiation factor 5B-like protein [Tanacetum coccineum]